MKKGLFAIVLLLLLTMAFSMTGCRMISQKVTEDIVEGAVEEALGGDVNITDDGASITTEDGSITAGDDLGWPGEAMGNLPVPDGIVTFVMNDSTYCSVEVSELPKDEAQGYWDALIALGYTEGLQAVDESSMTFNCVDNAGASASFIYDFEAGTAIITYMPPQADADVSDEEQTGGDGDQSDGDSLEAASDAGDDTDADTDNADGEEDMTDVAPWPADFMGDIPELAGKITAVLSNGSYQKDVEMAYVREEDARAFIEDLQACGFDVDSSVSEYEGYIEYYAFDENDNEIFFSRSDSGETVIVLTKPE